MIKKLSKRPFRLLAYGPPSAGKSTLAAHSPKPVFLCCEDGARELNVDAWSFEGDRVTPNSSEEFRKAVQTLAKDHAGYETLVVDGLGALDKLMQKEITDAHPKWNGNFQHEGFGKPEAIIFAKWREILVDLERANHAGLNIVLIGHARIVKHSPPDAAPYDRYQVDVTGNSKDSNTAGMFLEWCDTQVFCRFEQMTVEEGKRTRGGTIQGNRVMYLQRTEAWDAKARSKHAPAVIPMSWSELDKVMNASQVKPEDVRAQIEVLIPQLPADKQAATSKWLTEKLTLDDLVMGLDRIRGVVSLSAQ